MLSPYTAETGIAWIFSIEFFCLGGVAGVVGTALGSGFAGVLLKRLMDVDYHPRIATHLLAILAASLVAVLAGWAASFRILGRKPLEILRDE